MIQWVDSENHYISSSYLECFYEFKSVDVVIYNVITLQTNTFLKIKITLIRTGVL